MFVDLVPASKSNHRSAALLLSLLVALALPVLAGCDDDPTMKGDPPDGGDPDGQVEEDGSDEVDGDVPDCLPLDGDYVPGAEDEWDECVSDDGEYTLVEDAASTITRIAAFEDIAELLFTGATPDEEDFIDAYVLYTTAEGLESRVERRYDLRVAGTPSDEDAGGIDCRQNGEEGEENHVADNPEFCIGPSTIGPLLDDAFNEGGAQALAAHAGTIEGALLWFLYISQYKESYTCSGTVKDCDSSWAYVTGGGDRGEEKGFTRYVREIDGAAADRIYDGTLAVRCWRDLDDAIGFDSVDAELRDAARNQLERASLDGAALIVADRLTRAKGASGDAYAFYIASAKALGNALEIPMVELSEEDWDAFESALEGAEPTGSEIDDALTAIAIVFPRSCELEE